jgi:hypothetical protein
LRCHWRAYSPGAAASARSRVSGGSSARISCGHFRAAEVREAFRGAVRGLQLHLIDEVGSRALDGGSVDRFHDALPV